MTAILSVSGSRFSGTKRKTKRVKKNFSCCSVLNMKKNINRKKQNPKSFKWGGLGVGLKLHKLGATLVLVFIMAGGFYLYQVNDLTNKGYEMREVENKIASLKKDNERNKIKEMELRSMYNIEKNTKNLDLVGYKNVSYLEIDGPIAMK